MNDISRTKLKRALSGPRELGKWKEVNEKRYKQPTEDVHELTVFSVMKGNYLLLKIERPSCPAGAQMIQINKEQFYEICRCLREELEK